MNAFFKKSSEEWIICYVGEDQPAKLGLLASELNKPKDTNGNGKRVPSGFSYWGIVPTVAWRDTCGDQYYTLMSGGIARFPRAWSAMKGNLIGNAKHYVSLGPGTGDKDSTIINCLNRSPKFKYIPIDMSAEMLRLGTKSAISKSGLVRTRVIPLQIDFSSKENMQEIQSILQAAVGDESILFSILGNTLANFENDEEFLANIALLIRPQDYLLLELATTMSIESKLLKHAVSEYQKSKRFREFVVSALLQNTDLPIEDSNIEFQGEIEEEKSLLVKCLYVNKMKDMKFRVPGVNSIQFELGDTIRLSTTRKYSHEGLKKIFRGAGMRVLNEKAVIDHNYGNNGFGSTLYLLQTGGKKMPDTIEYDFFIAHASCDSGYANELYEHLVRKNVTVFLAEKSLKPGDNWTKLIPQKQVRSRVTLVLMSKDQSDAYYDKEEVAIAIDLARKENIQHRVIPIYVGKNGDSEEITPLYGLRALNALDMRKSGIERVVDALVAVLR